MNWVRSGDTFKCKVTDLFEISISPSEWVEGKWEWEVTTPKVEPLINGEERNVESARLYAKAMLREEARDLLKALD